MRGAFIALVALCVAGCGSTKPIVHSQTARVHAEGEGGAPVEGASVAINGKPIGATRADGLADVSVEGVAGDRFRIDVACPEGFAAAAPGSHEILVTPTLGKSTPEIVFRCRPTSKHALVVVRTEGGANLPIRYLGRELARTDASGAATVVVLGKEGESFELVLDTSRSKKIHPQNPALTFRIGAGDDAFVFDQKFSVDKPRPAIAFRPSVPRAL